MKISMPRKLRQTVLPLLAALIWGTAFVMQKGNTAGALTFNAARSLIAFLFLLPVILLFTKGDLKHILSENTKEDTKTLWLGGFLCGLMLASATFLQQYGLDHGTEAGKAGFLTAMYMVLVPVFGLFLHKKTGFRVWVCVFIAAAGLYFLSIRRDLSFRSSDLFIAPCAVLFAVQILLIDRFSVHCSPIRLSCIQFLTSFVLSAVFAPLLETPEISGLYENTGQILYLGILSSGVAYTLQMISLKPETAALPDGSLKTVSSDREMTVVSILLSMESVFSVIAGALILHERLSLREYFGCGLMFAAVLISQLPDRKKEKQRHLKIDG